MSWKVAFVIALAVGQVPARPDTIENVEPTFLENVQSDSDSRIVSGWDAMPGQFPHHVAVRMINPNGASLCCCGGSLVAKSWVISAAHCTAGRARLQIHGGVIDVNNPEFTSESTEWFNYPTFIDELPNIVQPNDISLVKLKDSVRYTRLTQPIRIQPRAEVNRNYENLVLIASGHGATWTGSAISQKLQWVYLFGVSNEACGRNFGTALITNNAICARYFNVTSQSTCQGDSGGPLIHVENGVPTLVGIASFVAGGTFGCHSGLPAGFIRPGPFHDWLTQISGLDFENLNEDDEEALPTVPPTITTEVPPTDPPTTTTEAPTTTTEPPTEPDTEEPEKEEESNEESNEDSDDSSDSSEEDEDDPELKDLLKKLEVLVKVKVKMSKHGNKHKHVIHHNKTITHHH
ncbi:serine protease 3-like [Ostrinia furnacalis]|uniref:serine protease 3-like n=1 Tax=Ostrinia furnacalis TaxID=93504 RepID=UPI001038E8BD|nr:serine protease 3-like [Ostrinia furnacalis]